MHSIWSFLLNKEGGETLNGILHAGKNSLRSVKRIVTRSKYKIDKAVIQRAIAGGVVLATMLSAHLTFAYTETVIGFVYSSLERRTEVFSEENKEKHSDSKGYLVEGAAIRAISDIPKKQHVALAKNTIFDSAPVPVAEAANTSSAAKSRIRSVPTSAYSSTPDQTDSTPFTTASGTRVRDGVVAANFLPIGTKIRIPEYYGNKVFVVEDRMNARYWKKVDIWMPTRHEALQWGVRHVTVEIVN